ncbi:MAG: NAD-dependent epimerase/dehydratase family protein, partial [Clostridia bacterium]|nr:NAD-dependent epimerase/dehydratase family protein [Clostridia bacterium]
MKVILTGGAGFIGSCFLKTLNDMGVTNVIVVDNINSEDKTQNLKNKKYLAYYDKTEFLSKLNEISGVTHIVHLGACSSTTETNVEYLYKNNVEYGISLYEYALKVGASFIYASSAATYGLGERGFSDKLLPEELTPLNPYGVSKNLFDKFIYSKTTKPKQVVGLKFFNVYGP